MKARLCHRPVLALGFVTVLALAVSLAGVKPPEKPAEIAIGVSPERVAPGGTAEVTLTLEPIDGVKINRYPKIKLRVPAHEVLAGEAEAAIGNDKPPPPGQKTNYWDEVDPLKLTLTLAEAAPPGSHEVQGKLVYYFCVPASGFCAPKRVPVTIPIVIE
jgi:hypothetical protein